MLSFGIVNYSCISWHGILVVLALWLLPRWQAARSQGLTAGNRFDRENEARKTLAQIIGGVLVLAGLYSSLQTFSLQQHTFDLQREGQITDRFTKAIDQLGAVETGPDGKPKINLEVRLGGIYALERIARDSPTDHWTIIEVLSTYVRENSPAADYAGKTPRERTKIPDLPGVSGRRLVCGTDEKGPPSLRTTTPTAEVAEQHLRADIQAILTVIGRRDITHDDPNRWVNLSNADLDGASLIGASLNRAHLIGADLDGAALLRADLGAANLSGAHLTKACLHGADLSEAHLSHADLDGADLSEAVLTRADLHKADLSGADLNEADLNEAHLHGARFYGAVLDGAVLTRADLFGADLNGAGLNGADLSGAELRGVSGLNQSHLDKARGDLNTKLPEGLTRPESWH